MIAYLVTRLWGSQECLEEGKHLLFLGLLGFCLVGTYWLLKPIKDAVFIGVVGVESLPYVKAFSFWLTIPLVFGYSKLVDFFPKQQLLASCCTVYLAFFLGCSWCIEHPVYGVASIVDPWTRTALGWLIYLGVETFGTLVFALFWAFVVSITRPEKAAQRFPIVVAGGQLGALVGPTCARCATWVGMKNLLLCASFGVAVLLVLILLFSYLFPATVMDRAPESKHQTGGFEGLRLILSKPYLRSVFCIVAFQEIVIAMLEYRVLFFASGSCHSIEGITEFVGLLGQATNGLALVIALWGTTFWMQRFGLTACLCAFPFIIGCLASGVWFFSSLFMAGFALVAARSLGYALLDPCKEAMYIPTSRDIRFKSKGWVDMFGKRGSRAFGSTAGAFLQKCGGMCFAGSCASVVIIAAWMLVARYLGNYNQRLLDTNTILR